MNIELSPARCAQILDVLERNKIDVEEAIFVGGIALEAFGVRPARDIDLVVSQAARDRLTLGLGTSGVGPFSAINLPEDLQVLQDPYRAVGVSDAELFSGELFVTFELLGQKTIRVARPELEFAKKNFRRRPKDLEDLYLLEQLSRSSELLWDWKIVPTRAVAQPVDSKRRNRIVRVVLSAVRNPYKVAQSIYHTGLRQAKKAVGKWPRLNSKNLGVLSQQTIDIGVLFQLQRPGGKFSRYDVLLRAIIARMSLDGDAHETGFRENLAEYWGHYQKMQKLRYPARASTSRYRSLLEKIARSGFKDDRHPLVLSQSGVLLDGAHRLACAVAVGVDRVPFVTQRSNAPKNYGRSWFSANSFPKEMLEELDTTQTTIFSSTGAYFRGIIWPPAQDFASDILKDIKAEYAIISSDLGVDCPDLGALTHRIYSSDDIEHWKVEKKLAHFVDYTHRCTFFEIDIPDPRYIQKVRSGSYMAQEVIELKKRIRQKYSPLVQGYVEDVIVHIADNPSMSRDISRALLAKSESSVGCPPTSQPSSR